MDKNKLITGIRDAFNGFIAAIRKHDDVNKKRADGGWSAAQNADHILKGTDTNLGSSKKSDRPVDKNENSIKAVFLNFNEKYPAMPQLQPDDKQYSKEQILAALSARTEEIVQMINTEDLTEICVDWEVPGWGNLSKYECVILFETHTIRHTKQVAEMLQQ